MAHHYSFDENGNQILPTPKTISEINEYIKSLIEQEMLIQDIYVVGEISNFKNHMATGHFYFTLKDEKSEIKAVMFKTYSQRVKFKPENGMKVLVHARVGVYPVNGTYQLYIDTMQPDGIGSLYLAYEQLKARLEREGYFSKDHKKELPKMPKTVGVITSSTGAAVRDIINVVSRRSPNVKVLIYPSLVQGKEAPGELIKGIEYFNSTQSCDVIIIGRGGGSIEDLWAFNDEGLAKSIYLSQIPVISAVGHETDFTICDFVADLRAPTPSAAAELVTPDISVLRERIKKFKQDITDALMDYVQDKRSQFEYIKDSKVFKRPLAMLDMPKMRVALVTDKFYTSFSDMLFSKRQHFSEINSRLVALNPMSVLSRGYGAVFSQNNDVVKSVSDVCINDSIKVVLKDGSINAIVEEIVRSKK